MNGSIQTTAIAAHRRGSTSRTEEVTRADYGGSRRQSTLRNTYSEPWVNPSVMAARSTATLAWLEGSAFYRGGSRRQPAFWDTKSKPQSNSADLATRATDAVAGMESQSGIRGSTRGQSAICGQKLVISDSSDVETNDLFTAATWKNNSGRSGGNRDIESSLQRNRKPYS